MSCPRESGTDKGFIRTSLMQIALFIVPNGCIYSVHFSLVVLVVVVCLCLLGIHEFDFCVSMRHHIWVLLGPA